MLLKLSLLLSTIGIIACNVPFDTTKEVKYEETNQIYQRNYQHSEYLNSYTEVVYKYETNEVESVDDLVIGNIYHFEGEVINGNYPNVSFDCGYLNGQIILEDYVLDDNYFGPGSIDSPSMSVYFDDETFNIAFDVGVDWYLIMYDYSVDLDIDFVFYGGYSLNPLIQYISSTDYNEIESVIYHQPQTIIGYFNEFLEENLFSEIPFVREMTFNIGGQNINLLTYLIIAFGLIVSVGILIGLFLLLRWLFKIFANCFIMR